MNNNNEQKSQDRDREIEPKHQDFLFTRFGFWPYVRARDSALEKSPLNDFLTGQNQTTIQSIIFLTILLTQVPFARYKEITLFNKNE